MENNKKTSHNSFVRFIAYMQVLSILMVVFGHSFHMYPGVDTQLLIYKMMYSFRMPTFIFVSGFLMIYTTFGRSGKVAPSIGKFTLTKVKRLLIPFMVLTAVTFVPRSLMSGMADDSIELSLKGFAMSFVDMDYMPIPFFWFIHVSFMLLVVSYGFVTICEKRGISRTLYLTLMAVVFLVLPFTDLLATSVFSLNLLKDLSIFFLVGMVYAYCFNRIDQLIPWGKLWFFAMMFVIWICAYFVCVDTQWMILCKLAGITMMVSLSHVFEERGWRFIDHLVGANYMIFLLSWYFNVGCQQVLSHYVTMPWYFYSVMSLLCGVYFPWLFYRYLCRNKDKRWVRSAGFLLGQNLTPKSRGISKK